MNPVYNPNLRSYTCEKNIILDCVIYESQMGWKLLRKEDLENGKVMLVFTKFKALLIKEAKAELEKDFAVLEHKLFFPMDSDTE